MKKHPLYHNSIIIFLRKNLFSSFFNMLLSIVVFFFLFKFLVYIWNFLYSTNWVFSGVDPCLNQLTGLCIPYIKAKWPSWIYGLYPPELRWRADICFLILFFLILFFIIGAKYKFKPFIRYCVICFFVVVFFILLYGGIFGLIPVLSNQIGGLLLTFMISFIAIPLSIPIGTLLALGRQSKTLPVLRILCVAFIEICRGVPLVTILFVSSVMLPMFLPQDFIFSKLSRAITCITLFTSCYMAETIRGGLQAIPKGQYEASKTLGFHTWQYIHLIILPQTFKKVIPGITNNVISTFKDSSLVMIIGLFDFLGMVKLTSTDGYWATSITAITGYLVAGCIYWIFCFVISMCSLRLEKN